MNSVVMCFLLTGLLVLDICLQTFQEGIEFSTHKTILESIAEDSDADHNRTYCRKIFDPQKNKNGTIDSSSILQTLVMSNVNVKQIEPVNKGNKIVQCHFEFWANQLERVQIKFFEFSLPFNGKNESECKTSDYLEVLILIRDKFEKIDIFCGYNIPKPIMSNGSKMILQFIRTFSADQRDNSKYGFKAEYRFLKNFGITTGEQVTSGDCSFAYNSSSQQSGWFSSPNFPGFYPKNLQCNYYFYGKSEERVLITFTFFDVEGINTCEDSTASDFVEFSNFMSTDRKFAKICGKRNKFAVKSDGRFFRITFQSNDRFDKTGFRASYDFESKFASIENISRQDLISCASIELSRVNFILSGLLVIKHITM